ncbi:hypothetical protein ST201phi2-1p392 [Pseudomonas phage 201phi2-1]|uniref:Uncharacterized protein n=1 Tax=Pseudomonas phage 201phi2-1 TaxID=198110 RepID=B3FJQ1_BP201|nr:hypothetical protein ST201phi2-1p392 [Pseudomonas phage 201phi2-1]ABY63216.1 hypothetical protein 201phi2-1p392 [Pseudomonas phage 201phi2-1]
MVFNPKKEGNKLVYCTRNAKVVAAKDLWPELDNTDGINVLQAEHYVHDEWHPIRTSMIVDIRGNDYETRNSIYRVIDK